MSSTDFPVRTMPRIKSIPKDIIEHIAVTLFLLVMLVLIIVLFTPAAIVLAILDWIGAI